MAVATQKHLHLALTLGAAPENAPAYKWVVQDRLEIPRGTATLRESLTGVLRAHVLLSSGVPLIKKDYSYTIILTADFGYTLQQRKDQLFGMLNRRVYLVDCIHPGDGEDHTSSVKTMFLKDISPLKVFDRVLARHYVDIELVDASV